MSNIRELVDKRPTDTEIRHNRMAVHVLEEIAKATAEEMTIVEYARKQDKYYKFVMDLANMLRVKRTPLAEYWSKCERAYIFGDKTVFGDKHGKI